MHVPFDEYFWFGINGYTKIRMSSEYSLSYFLAAVWMNFFKVQRKIRHRTVLFIIQSSQLKPEAMPKKIDQNSLLPLPGEKKENGIFVVVGKVHQRKLNGVWMSSKLKTSEDEGSST